MGVGGLLEGEPRTSDSAWNNYQSWIKSGKMKSAAKPHAAGKGYVIEWLVDYSLLQITAGHPYHSGMPDTEMGINIALGDVDRPQDGDPKMGIRHENWFSGDRPNRTHIVDFGSLWLMAHGDGVGAHQLYMDWLVPAAARLRTRLGARDDVSVPSSAAAASADTAAHEGRVPA